MDTLTREQILAVVDLPREAVEVPEWGGTIYVRGLTGKEKDALEASFVAIAPDGKVTARQPQNLRARLLVQTIVDAQGERLFRGEADVEVLGQKSAAVLSRLFDTAQRLSGITPQDLEELKGNSAADPLGDSATS